MKINREEVYDKCGRHCAYSIISIYLYIYIYIYIYEKDYPRKFCKTS
jgi:hypothetical protein